MDLQAFFQSNLGNIPEAKLEFYSIFIRLTLSCIYGFYTSQVSHLSLFSKNKNPDIMQAQFLLTFVSTVTILVIGQNIAWAIGLFGALSFIRFRTILQEPRDTVLFFFSATIGIAIGVGQFLLALISCIFLTILLYVIKIIIYNKNNYYLKISTSNENCIPVISKFFDSNKVKREMVFFNMQKNTLTIRLFIDFTAIISLMEQLKIESPEFIKGYTINEDKD
jgi:hypothetical protein